MIVLVNSPCDLNQTVTKDRKKIPITALFASLILHVLIFLYITNTKYIDTELPKPRQVLSITLNENSASITTNTPIVEKSQQPSKNEQEIASDSTTPSTAEQNIQLPSSKDLLREEPTLVAPTQSEHIPPKRINWRANIEQVIQADATQYQQEWLANCGQGQCQSLARQHKLETDDRYGLAKYIRGSGGPSQHTETELVETVDTHLQTLERLASLDEIDPIFVENLSRDIALLKSDRRWLDCNNDFDSGTCAGEVDIVKLIYLAKTIIKGDR